VSLDFSSLEARVTAIEKWIKGVKDQLLWPNPQKKKERTLQEQICCLRF
jgi:hypothetical protein